MAFTLNGVHSGTFNIIMLGVDRTVLPATNDGYFQPPGHDGSYLFARELSDRTIMVLCQFIEDTVENLRTTIRQMAAWIHTDTRVQLIFDDEPDKYYLAKVSAAIGLDQTATMGEFTLVFRCEPLAYSIVPDSADFIADSLTVINTGTAKAFPVFTVTFTAPAAEIQIYHDGLLVRLVKAFIIGDILVIDNSKGTVKLNGISVMTFLDWQQSDFFFLKSGTNLITATPPSVSTIATSFIKRWF